MIIFLSFRYFYLLDKLTFQSMIEFYILKGDNIMSDKSYLCKYQVESLVFMMGNEHIIMDASNILGIEYINDYDVNIRAILKISMRMDVRKKIWILSNRNSIVVKFELNKIGIDLDCDEYVTAPESIWNQLFSIYFDDNEENSDISLMEQRLELNEGEEFISNDINSENYYESHNFLDVYLFNPELLDASMNVFNAVFTNNTLQQFVGRLLTETKHKNVLMSRFENDEVYKELLVPANQAYKGLIYLDQYYGFYKTGALIYYDTDVLYILNSNGAITAKRDGEFFETIIMVSKFDSSTPGNGMMRKTGIPANFVSLSDDCINPQKFSESKNAKSGSNVKLVITDDVEMTDTEAQQSYINQRNESIIYSKKTDNKFASEIMKARMEENDINLYISANNLDISAFTPNKIYRVVFDEPLKQEKYGKYTYRLSYSYHYLKVESDSYMSASHHIVLKKASGQDIAI